MDYKSDAAKLDIAIRAGDLKDVRQLTENYAPKQIKLLETSYPDRDPVVIAIDCREEDIALYLLDKGFSYNKTYQWPDQTCNQWCYYDHQDDWCPCDYNAIDIANKKNLKEVVKLIEAYCSGHRKPGDTGKEMSPEQIPAPETMVKEVVEAPVKQTETGKITKAVQSPEPHPSQTTFTIAEAKVELEKTGVHSYNKNGDTALHQNVRTPAMVHVCANSGVHINDQNFDGNTALHLAVKGNHLESAKALLMNGSDLTIRNKLGQTAVEMAEEAMKTLLNSYKNGLVAAVVKGNQPSMQRILRLWPNLNSVIKEEKTAMDLAKEYKDKSSNHQACYNLLNDHKQNLNLVHAVLSEDLPVVKQILRTEKGWNVNIRYKDKKGETLLSCAIQQRNLQLVQLLIESGKCNVDVRIREHSWTDTTMPLYFRSVEKDCPMDIWRAIESIADCCSVTDRDVNGDTYLMRAILNDKPAAFIRTMLVTTQGHNLCCRNAEGLHAREIAQNLGKADVVAEIDDYVCRTLKYSLMKYPIAFYGQNHLNITNKDGESLLSLAGKAATDQDIKAINDYNKVEQLAIKLFKAAAVGNKKTVVKENSANYKDKNGYTALIRAIVFNQPAAADALITTWPVIVSSPDNHGRYPLHYIYALPEDQAKPFFPLLLVHLGKPGMSTEYTTDKDGREPAEYAKLRNTPEILQMLHDARTLDAYGKRGEALASLPEGAVIADS